MAQIAGIQLSEPLRSHHDIEKETANTKYMKKAVKHYQGVAKRASAAGHVIDVFACSLDQVLLLCWCCCCAGAVVVLARPGKPTAASARAGMCVWPRVCA